MKSVSKKPQSFKIPTPLDKLNIIENYSSLYENDIDVYTAMVKTIAKMINLLKVHHHTEINHIDITDLSFVINDVKSVLEKTITIFVTVMDGHVRKPYKITLFRQELGGDNYYALASRSWSTAFAPLANLTSDSQEVA